MAKTTILATATAENRGEIYKTIITAGSHTLITDEPKEYGGAETGPSPADYLCMSLASCKAITIRMYAQRKGWKVDTIKVTANFVKGDQTASGANTFFCNIALTGQLTDEQQKRILEIAKACPVDRLLRKASDVVTVIE